MRQWLISTILLVGCGAPDEIAFARMALDGLDPGEFKSVMVLVLDGKNAGCRRALGAASPLEDPALEIVRHALFTVDGSAKRLTLPAERKLLFYVEAFAGTDGWGGRVGRGCAEARLHAGRTNGISIVLARDPRDG